MHYLQEYEIVPELLEWFVPAVSSKLNLHLPSHPKIPFLDVYLRELKTCAHVKRCAQTVLSLPRNHSGNNANVY